MTLSSLYEYFKMNSEKLLKIVQMQRLKEFRGGECGRRQSTESNLEDNEGGRQSIVWEGRGKWGGGSKINKAWGMRARLSVGAVMAS